MSSVKRSGFDAEVEEYMKIAEAKYGPLKKIDPNFKLPDRVSKWVGRPTPEPQILFKEWTSPGIVLPVVLPVYSVPLRPILFEVFYKKGVPHRQFEISTSMGTIITDKYGKYTLNQYEGLPFHFTTATGGGYAGYGIDRDLPESLRVISEDFIIQPHDNHILLITKPKKVWINGVEIPDPEFEEDVNPHIASQLKL